MICAAKNIWLVETIQNNKGLCEIAARLKKTFSSAEEIIAGFAPKRIHNS